MADLKPCPFCGGEVKRIIGWTSLMFFKCPKCGAVVSFDNDYYNRHTSETEKAWNRRDGGKEND